MPNSSTTASQDERASTSSPATAPSKAKQEVAPEDLESPLKPLLWLLVPFILIMIYGLLSPN